MRSDRVTEIKRALETGQYRVDPYAVADAMIRRAELELESAARGSVTPSQKLCSKPERFRGASVNTAPGGPARTAPIRLRAAIVLGHAA